MDFLKALNKEQYSAVTSNSQFQLVLAGAGSGKTRVLVNKIAWLMFEHGISPYQILALTFTNKAAKNMHFQLEQLLNQDLTGMWMGTFHGIAHRILRRHAAEINLDPNFQIIDQKDQMQIIKGIYKNFNISEQKWPITKTAYIIQDFKAKGLRAINAPRENLMQENFADIYKYYEETCINSHLLDFTELILKTVEILNSEAHIRELYHQQFQHVMLDEFQDTNALQYQLMQVMTGPDTKIMAVGDDDQSIYSWRGASVEHMHEYSGNSCEITRLEQNFRSTNIILNAANNLISFNQNRLGKKLWSENHTNEDIVNFTAYNDIDEASFVVTEIKSLIDKGVSHNEIAVLYRSNAQSRVLEEQLNRTGIPYKIYGGLRFFDRMEIKDILAYLSLCANNHNDSAFERVINKPARGIGLATINGLRATAYKNSCTLYDAIPNTKLATRASNALTSFIELIEKLKADIKDLSLADAIDHIAHATGLMELYQADEPHQASARIENIQELMHAASIYSDMAGDVIASFISEISLEPIETEQDSNKQVQLMTVHSAKGLEFTYVFVTGLEEGLFPHQMSMQENGLEEERRLCYVAITRAKEKLYLSHAQIRRLNGKTSAMRKSRFLAEMLPKQQQLREDISQTGDMKKFYLGQAVQHKKFGTGIIINAESDRVQINFSDHGLKWILAEFID